MNMRILALVSERDHRKTAHRGMESSLDLYRVSGAGPLDVLWVRTADLEGVRADALLRESTAPWAVPSSPYESTAGAFSAIGHARLKGKAFLQTCGGFQHAIMEFRQTVLDRPASHAELGPEAKDPVIAPRRPARWSA